MPKEYVCCECNQPVSQPCCKLESAPTKRPPTDCPYSIAGARWAPQQGQSGATTSYIALAEKWEKEAKEMWEAINRSSLSLEDQIHIAETLEKCAKELRAI